MTDRYVWLLWTSAFLIPWVALFIAFPAHRTVMWKTSVVTSLFGLTEPLFVPEYWNPPTLFDLAQRTGFDLESLIFCFAIGGTGAVMYNLAMGEVPVPVTAQERASRRHRFHPVALAAPFVVFVPLVLLPWNPIYPSLIALVVGSVAAALCRPDLWWKSIIGGSFFAGYYVLFMLGLEFSASGYIERVWNLEALSGPLLGPIPLEEIAFGFLFGMYWTGVYEHLTWKRSVRVRPRPTHGVAT